MADVPCNGCTRCCTGPIMLHPSLGDDLTVYRHKRFVAEAGWRLEMGPDGKCIYLVEEGCSIYEDRPALCRAFDCRVYAKNAHADDVFFDQSVVDRGLELGEPHATYLRRP